MVVCSATNVESCLCLKARKVWQRGRLRRWGRRRSDAELQRFNVCLSQRKTGIFETGLIARPAGQGRAVRPAHTPQIKKELPQTSWGSSFFMPVVGVEPTRVISTRDFESPSSAIPTHRRIAFERLLLYRILWVKSRGSFAAFLKLSRPMQNT